MLERIRTLINKHPDKAAFFTIVGRFFPKYSTEYQLIAKAYKTAKEEFREKYRESGERYFEHLRCVALILIVYLRVRDADVIAAALLHDIMEDIPDWDEDKLALKFNVVVAQLVSWVTKESADNYAGDKEARNRDYHRKLYAAKRDAILIKMADRLHNVITLWGTNEEKQRRKVRETQDFYLPLAEAHFILVYELEHALDEVMASWESSEK